MKRRSFLKQTTLAGLITWVTPSQLLTVFKPNNSKSTGGTFQDPARENAPYTWWHWMNGNISKEGITLDLEAMRKAGLGGFQLFEAGISIPKGPVTYLSKQWLAMLAHTVTECKRLDLEFAMHNCPGWSSSGGPWITPELAMQQITWSETTVSGNKRFSGTLAEPVKRLNYYRDAAVVAFPALSGEKTAWASRLKKIEVNGQSVDLKLVRTDGSFKEPLKFGQPDLDNVLELMFPSPVPLRSLTMLASGSSPLTLQYSNDAVNFITLTEIAGEIFEVRNSRFPCFAAASFKETSATHFRLLFRGELTISAISISGADRMRNWPSKANYPGSKPARVTTPDTPDHPSGFIDIASVIDLTSKVTPDGELNWDVPAGEWTVLRIGHTPVGRLNHSAPATGTGLEIDKFSAAALDFHWKHVLENILPLLKLRQGGKVGLLIDSYEMGLQNWTAGFPVHFAQRQKYNLMPYLPALTGRVVGDIDTTERFLQDFRKVQADLMCENYYTRFAQLCKANNIISYTEPYEGGNFEEMQIGRSVDISMGEFWAGNTMLWNNSVLDRTVKLAASIAHSKGQTIVGAEAFSAEAASGKWQQYPFAMKGLGDVMFTKGLTRIIFHRYAHQPHPTAVPGMTMGPWGIHFDRTNTWFEKSGEWIKYLSRCQLMLRKGVFAADIAYFTGEDVPSRTVNPETTSYCLPPGYDYDLINAACLINECTVKNGKIANRHGVSYTVLILPGIKLMSIQVLRKLAELVNNGLILIGPPPVESLGLKDKLNEAEFKQLVIKLWGSKSKVGAGRVIPGTNLKTILREIKLEPDFAYTAGTPDAAINFIHRKEDGRHIYFIANRRRRRENIVCSFRLADGTATIWDPLTGLTTPALFSHAQNGRTSLPLQLAPYGSVFVVFEPLQRKPTYYSLYRNGQAVISSEKFSVKPRGLYPALYGSFTVSCWVKPETDIALTEEEFFGDRRTDYYAVHPVAGERYYGEGHAGSGFTVGRNGVVLFERANDFIRAVLFVPVPISGWSKLAVVYHENVPSVYVNNLLIRTGEASTQLVHPSVDEAYQDEGASFYNGEIINLMVTDHAMTSAELAADSTTLPPPGFPETANLVAGRRELCIWKNGNYTLKTTTGKIRQFRIDVLPVPVTLQSTWTVKFQQDRGAPKEITMDKLVPLQKHSEPGVRYFSGTAEYLTEFSFNTPAFPYQIKLDLGRVEVMAEVSLNGMAYPILWSQPYSLDITSAIRSGTNKLSIKVTNLWPNRLIGDENLPQENDYSMPGSTGKHAKAGAGGIKKLPDWYINGQPKPAGGRTTFSTWKHYNKDSPLLESGLLGPVIIAVGILKDL